MNGPAADNTPLSGAAGATLRGLLAPYRLWRSLPVIAGVFGIALGALYLAQEILGISAPGPLLAVLLGVSPLLGLEALRQRRGVPAESAELAAFIVRYALLATAWATPWALLLRRAWPDILAVGNPLVPSSWGGVSAALALAAAFVVLLVGSLLLAAVCDTVGDLLRLTTWRRLWRLRHELLPSVALVLGGTLLAAMLVIPALSAVALGMLRLAALDPRIGILLTLAAYLSPLAVTLLLSARLAGAAAALLDAQDARAAAPHGAATPTTLELPAALPPLVPAALTPRWTSSHVERPRSDKRGDAPALDAVAFIKAFQSLAARGETDLPGAIADGEAMLAKQPRAAGVLAELARLYRKAARPQDALSAASRAINLAVLGGMAPVAVAVYDDFRAERHELTLEPQAKTQLGVMLRAQGRSEDAAWCLEG